MYGALVLAVFLIVIVVLSVAMLCVIFSKSGEKAWKAIIPFYNNYILHKIVWGNGWLFLLLFIPFCGAIFSIITVYKLARVFGKGRFFSTMMVLIPIIPMAILAFGSSEYGGSRNKSLALSITVSIIVGVIVMIGYGLLTYNLIKQVKGTMESSYTTMNEFGEDFDRNMEIYRDSYNYPDEVEGSREELSENTEEKKVSDGAVRLEYFDGFQVDVPVVNSDIVDASGSTAFYNLEDGTSVSISLIATSGDLDNIIDDYVTSRISLINEMDFYSDLKEYEVSRKDNSACKRLSYSYSLADGLYPMEYIVKAEKVGDGYCVVYSLEKDGYTSDKNTDWEQVLDLYGIGVVE